MLAFNAMCSDKNLLLAWKRIQSGQNIQYKNYFRATYDAYNLNLSDNIKHLSQMLKDGVYQPDAPERIMIPKSSGLGRPITLLSVTDQIVLQAIANIYADKFWEKKLEIDATVCCSNRLKRQMYSTFFFEPWRESYGLYKKRVYSNYKRGQHYVADFDLAAFYDTISHELLTNIFAPRGGNRAFREFVKRCLYSWTSQKCTHGIPQGPIASDFLAECFMIEIDLKMRDDFSYVRYVDDIRILGKSEEKVYKGVILLERMCRERGLIPHSGKFGLRYAENKYVALGKTPSLAATTTSMEFAAKDNAVMMFMEGLSSRRDHITDSTRIKYVLYHCPPYEEVLKFVLKLLPLHAEMIDSFSVYLCKFGKKRKIANRILSLLQTGVAHDYVEGAYWAILETVCYPKQMEDVIELAVERVKKIEADRACTRNSLINILNCSEDTQTKRILYRLIQKENNFIIKSNALTRINNSFPTQVAVYKILQKAIEDDRKDIVIMAAWYIGFYNIEWQHLNIDAKNICVEAQNVLKKLGVISSSKRIRLDSMGKLIERRFNTPMWSGWKKLMKKDYKHCHRLLIMAEQAYSASPTAWMGYMDSFNDLLTRNFLDYLRDRNPGLKIDKTVNKNGCMVKYGQLIAANAYVDNNLPQACVRLREFHRRRCNLPTSHAKDEQTQACSEPLSHSQRAQYIVGMTEVFTELFAFLSQHGL